jgi:23S rRNA (guanosine2251-2'-O)-methyltransferase
MTAKAAKPPEKPIWISGVNPIREVLKSKTVQVFELVVARDDPRVEEIKQGAEAQNIPRHTESREALSLRLGHRHHQGVAALVSQFPTIEIESLLGLPLAEREPLLILDSIQDPQNLGAIIRSGCFLGARAVVLPKDRSAHVTEVVVKIAAGGASHVPIIEVTNLVRAMETLKESGIWIAGLDLQGSSSLFEADLSVPLGLVVGNEQKGLRPLVRKQCDLLLHIPPCGPIDSLNAATAGAVALAEVQRQRRGRPGRR